MFDISPALTETIVPTQIVKPATPKKSTASTRNSKKKLPEMGELNLIGRSMDYEYLSPEIEYELACAWRDHKDETARDRLILSHMRLASRIVRKKKRQKNSENDLMQEAVIGLSRAVENFDPDNGNSFATYASWWIRASLQDAMMRDHSAVRIKSSSANRTAFFTLSHIENRAEIELRKNMKFSPTSGEISDEAARMIGVSSERLGEIKNSLPGTYSLNAPVAKNEEDFGEQIDMLVSEAPSAEEIVVEQSDMANINQILLVAFENLTDRETYIIKNRPMSLDPMTLEELSVVYGVTRERIRQIEARAFEKIRDSLKVMGIEDMSFLNS